MAKLAGQDETQGALYSGGIDPKTGLPVSAEEMAAAQRAAHMTRLSLRRACWALLRQSRRSACC